MGDSLPHACLLQWFGNMDVFSLRFDVGQAAWIIRLQRFAERVTHPNIDKAVASPGTRGEAVAKIAMQVGRESRRQALAM